MRSQSLNPDCAENVYLEQEELNGARVGTVDTAVLRFNPPSPDPIIEGAGIASDTTVENGTIWTISKPGVYEVELEAEVGATNTVVLGISKDVAAAGLTADPAYGTAGMVKVSTTTNPAGTVQTAEIKATIRVSGAEAQAGCLIRAHGTDGAAGAPAGLALAGVRARITRINGYAA